MYNPTVNKAFSFTSADHARYGATSFGDACLLSKQVLSADQGTRFIQVTVGGWDMHQNIYAADRLPSLGKHLDTGVSQLLLDLQGAGLFDQTMVFMAGEFGRTVGALTPPRAAITTRSNSRSSPAAASWAAKLSEPPMPMAATPPTSAGRNSATCTRKISRPRFIRPWESTGPPSATTIRLTAASPSVPPRTRFSIFRLTSSGRRRSSRRPSGTLRQPSHLSLARAIG